VFRRVQCLAVYVTDMERAKKFYTEVLGFDGRVDLGPSLCFLRSKSGEIDIYLESGHKPTSLDNQTSRLSFFLESEKTASETYAALKGAGVRLFGDAPELVSDDTACFKFADPDGNILEVSGKP
jgi:catechol 2,3-dioxygenase-like lactoylglutathione lyase family enzyme